MPAPARVAGRLAQQLRELVIDLVAAEAEPVESEQVRVEQHLHQVADVRRREVLGKDAVYCPGRKPPKRAAKRPARPYKSTIQNRFK